MIARPIRAASESMGLARSSRGTLEAEQAPAGIGDANSAPDRAGNRPARTRKDRYLSWLCFLL